MATLQPVRGTHDLLPEEERRHRIVAETARAIAGRYGFEPMATPLIEFKDVFVRSVGETSDIVSKEMFQVSAPSGAGSDDAAMVLRPENTAAVVRALIGAGRLQTLPQRVFYYGPMFRYERPQKGRLRQFHQIGAELIGAASPLADVETIACAADILSTLLPDAPLRLELNTLGDAESRQSYREALVLYLRGFGDQLSPVSRDRLERNPLRVLDSKEPEDRAIIADAPRLQDHLTEEAAQFFERVQSGLATLDIAFTVSPRLVRGLDYYSHTVFEFITDQLGAQGTVLAGGRYDGLVHQMGGPSTPGIGWAAGVERLSALLGDVAPPAPPVMLIPAGGKDVEAAALALGQRLRAAGLTVELIYSGGVKKGLQRANKIGAKIAIIVGETELANGMAVLRNLDAQSQETIPLHDLAARLLNR